MSQAERRARRQPNGKAMLACPQFSDEVDTKPIKVHIVAHWMLTHVLKFGDGVTTRWDRELVTLTLAYISFSSPSATPATVTRWTGGLVVWPFVPRCNHHQLSRQSLTPIPPLHPQHHRVPPPCKLMDSTLQDQVGMLLAGPSAMAAAAAIKT